MAGIAKSGVPSRAPFTAAGVHTCLGNTGPFDVDVFTPNRAAAAKAICRPCPVRADCLRWALDQEEPFGVLGGLTAAERRRLGPVDDVDTVVRRLHGAEAVAVGRRVVKNKLSRKAAAARLGERDTERVLLILRHAPHLGTMVVDGWLTLEQAALHADPAGRSNLDGVAA